MNSTSNKSFGKKTKQYEDTLLTVKEPCGLLEFLLVSLSNRSRNNVKSLLAHEEVLIDGSAITQFDYPLVAGQTVKIIRTVNRGEKNALDIIYEDDELVVINKPAGLLSIATEKEKDNTAYHMLTDYVQKNNPAARIFAVHRIDRDTSGVLIVAKNEKIKFALQNDWANLVSKRGYLALVEGELSEKSGTIHSWLLETKTMMMYSSSIPGTGLEAITEYKVLRENSKYSLLDIQLETGRKNQIRVHMKDIGHSVVGDRKYGAKTNPLRRLGLHAYKLELKHPFTDKVLYFEAQIPKGFNFLFKSDKSKRF